MGCANPGMNLNPCGFPTLENLRDVKGHQVFGDLTFSIAM
jgi:hypothetical protein